MNLYRYFSLLFSYPTEDIMRDINELSAAEGFDGHRCAEIFGTVSLEELQAEYTRMFISAYPKLLCPPYESYYREGIVYGNSSIEVSEWYQKCGLDFACEGQPPDLLSAELDFLALTNDASFLARMKEWVFYFTARVKVHSALYGPAASALEIFLKREMAAVTDAAVG